MNTEILLVDSRQAARMLSISVRHFYSMVNSGRFGLMPVQGFGRKKLWSVEEMKDWIRAGCPRREVWQNEKKS